MISKFHPFKLKYIELDTHMECIMPNGHIFLFDKEDYEIIKDNHWSESTGYPRNSKLGLLHRYLLKDQLSSNLQIDHINRNRLDNRRCNLRIVTRQENMHNKSVYKTNSSGYPGVKWNPSLNKWQAQITQNKIRKHLGVFENLQDAIMARRLAEQL